MNRKQKIVLWIGIAIIVLMGTFPPVKRKLWSRSSYRGSIRQPPTYTSYSRIEYRFLLNSGNGTVVLSNLLVQWVVVSIISGGLIYTFKNGKNKKEKDE